MKSLFENEKIKIFLDEENRWLFTDWIGFQAEKDIKFGGEKILELLIQQGVGKVLNDNRNVRSSWGGGTEWASNDWLPRMVGAGLKKFAWILSVSVLSQMSGKKVVEEADQSQAQAIRFFSDIDEASTWLKS